MKLYVRPVVLLTLLLGAACQDESKAADPPTTDPDGAPVAAADGRAIRPVAPAQASVGASDERAAGAQPEAAASQPKPAGSQPPASASQLPAAATPPPASAKPSMSASSPTDTSAAGSGDQPGPNRTDAGMPELDSGLRADGRPKDIVACYTEASSNDPATLGFWRAFVASDYAARDRVIEQLTAAVTAKPEEEELTFLLAHANMWRIAEARSLADWLVALDSVQVAEKNFQRAYELCPSDHRIPGWLAPLKILVGRMLGDSARLDEGVRMLEEAIERYPVFNIFSNIVAYGSEPRDSGNFRKAVETARYYLTLYDGRDIRCLSRPDEKACSNSTRIPHNIEGTALFMGDVFIKAKDRDAALKSYEFANKHPDAQRWPFREQLQARIRNIDQYIAAVDTGTELDDLAYAWSLGNSCAYCHQE